MTTKIEEANTHIKDAFSLQSDGIVELVRIQFADQAKTILNMTQFNTIVYQGETWENIPFKITENAQNANGEASRPKLAVVNPGGVFSIFVAHRLVEGATVTRYRVMKRDLLADRKQYLKQVWIVYSISTLDKNGITVELRSPFDGHNFKMPARAFYAPDFPAVRLQ